MNWASRSPCWAPSLTLAFPCRLKPIFRSILASVRSETGCPRPVKAAASFRVDLVVQANNDIGSPRLSGSISASGSRTMSGSLSASALRPPPATRTRGAGSGLPCISRNPRATVPGRSPVASAIALMLPRPNSAASTPSQNRRCRSSRCARNTACRPPSDSASRATFDIAQP